MSSSDSGSSSEPGREPPREADLAGARRAGPDESGLRYTRSLVVFPPDLPPVRGTLDPNLRTQIGELGGLEGLIPAAPTNFRALFLEAYGAISAIGRARTDVGVAIFAVDRSTGAVAASMALAGRPGRVLGAVVGRHSEADLGLADDPWLANRQLAVLVHPLTSWDPDRLRVSILDLRTHRPMVDERGRALASVLVEGPFLARLGRHALFILPTGDTTDFPEHAEDAWAQLPERVHLEERPAEPGAGIVNEARKIAREALRDARGAGPRERHSTITSMGPLLSPEERLREPEEPVVGELTLSSADTTLTYRVGARALERGVLLGRYERCDGAGVLKDERISRAHLLLKRVDGRLVALDTASTNGTLCLAPRLLAGPVRVVPVGERCHLRLADVAEVRWRMV